MKGNLKKTEMKKIIIITGIIILIVLGIIVTWTIRSSGKKEITQEIPTPTIALPTVSSDISVDLKAKLDNKAVALTIKGLSSSVESVEYELTYTTGAGLPRGVLGKIYVKNNEKEISRDDIVLGTCSSGKCVYDTGVTSIDLSLKFNTPEGSSVFRKTYPL